MNKNQVIILKGNLKSPEKAESRIVFPGGSISVCRTTDDDYWIHIYVNKHKLTGSDELDNKQGRIIDSRLDPFDNSIIGRLLDTANLQHIAVKIKTE